MEIVACCQQDRPWKHTIALHLPEIALLTNPDRAEVDSATAVTSTTVPVVNSILCFVSLSTHIHTHKFAQNELAAAQQDLAKAAKAADLQAKQLNRQQAEHSDTMKKMKSHNAATHAALTEKVSAGTCSFVL